MRVPEYPPTVTSTGAETVQSSRAWTAATNSSTDAAALVPAAAHESVGTLSFSVGPPTETLWTSGATS